MHGILSDNECWFNIVATVLSDIATVYPFEHNPNAYTAAVEYSQWSFVAFMYCLISPMQKNVIVRQKKSYANEYAAVFIYIPYTKLIYFEGDKIKVPFWFVFVY